MDDTSKNDSSMMTDQNPSSFFQSPSEEFSNFQTLNHFECSSPGEPYHLLSKKWYESWLAFLKNNSSSPGKIENSDLIDKSLSLKFFRHTSRNYEFANIFLKDFLMEGKDFIICTSKSYNFLKNIYSSSGPDIERRSIDMGEGRFSIEIHLKALNLVIYPEISRNNPNKWLQVSHSEKVGKVVEIIQGVLKSYFEMTGLDLNTMRLWKIDKDSKLEKGFYGEILTPGTILDNSLTIEECQVSVNDLIIVECCRASGKWTLTRKELKKRWKGERNSLTGLHNLGNTCFMNSALQCVLSTQFLKTFFLSNSYLTDLNTNNPLGSKNAELARTFAALVQSVWKGDQSSVSPWEFKKVIGKQAAQFQGYYQHDSHELLSYLLTGLHEDLNRVRNKTYYEMPELSSDVHDEEASQIHWEWFQKRNQSVVVDNMYGQYKSKLTCPLCGKISITFDPALYFTVTMPKLDIKKILVSLIPYDLDKPILRIFITVLGIWKISKLKEILFESSRTKYSIAIYHKFNFLCMADDDLELSEVYSNSLYGYEEIDEDGIFIPVILSKSGEKGYIFNSDKEVVSFPRVIKFPLSSTPQQMFNRLLSRFNTLVLQNHQNNPPFILNYVNSSKIIEGFFFNSQLPCDFCKKKCKNCQIDLKSDLTLQQLLENRKNSEGPFKVEVEWHPATKSLSMLNRAVDNSLHIVPEETKKTESHSLLNCLQKSAEVEKLDENNMWYCSQCKKHVQAFRTYQMFSAPKYLVLHFMRFKSRFHSSEKNNIFVDFPVNGLDLSEVVLSSRKPEVYDLYAVSNHFGGTSGGHYTAFVKHEEGWFEMDDSQVIPVQEQKIVSSAAYILFYKQRE
jgi:ubiquitin carboxyl-terminal hydrolase 4/11/15